MTAAKLKKGILVVLKYFTLILGAFVSILPLVVCVITAFKSPEQDVHQCYDTSQELDIC